MVNSVHAVRVLSNAFGYPMEGTGVRLDQLIELKEKIP